MRRSRIGSLAWIGLSTLLVLTAPARGEDGRFEIDIDCVAAGCFPGDTGGFPVTIANPGSYVLTSNLDGMAMMANGAISITGSGVFLDLNGFFISAVPPMGLGSLVISGSNVEVKNGRVTGLGGGVTASGGQIRLVNLRVSSSGGPGIDFGLGMGNDNQVIDTMVTGASIGIAAPGARSRIVGCQVSGGTSDGIRVGTQAIVADNTVTNNTGSADGIEVGTGSLVRSNILAFNGGFGINLDSSTLVIGNTAMNNTAGNIEVCATCTLVDNHAP